MPKNSSKTLSDFRVSADEIREEFNRILKEKPLLIDLNMIFEVAMGDMSLFPNILLTENATFSEYIERWVKGYEDATLNPPSTRIATPKSSCTDPAIKTIVQYATEITDVVAEEQSRHHNLFMSAENIQGSLLEEFIASKVRRYGWLWCKGNVLRAVDFCSVNGSALLQIKNKSNTENSSSSAIRAGTTIEKWYRLGTKSLNGVKIPDYKWTVLNVIINTYASGCDSDCNLTEEAYQEFLRDIADSNPKIITYL